MDDDGFEDCDDEPQVEEVEDDEEDSNAFYAIEEEEEMEDSFEREKRVNKENIAKEYESKIDDLERVYAGSFF